MTQATPALQRLLHSLTATPISTRGHSIPLTASLGLTLVRPTDTLDTILDRADNALYTAKGQGRNQLVVAP